MLVRTPLRHLAAAALVMEDGLPLDPLSCHATDNPRDTALTEEAFLAVTRNKYILSHVGWAVISSIPVQRKAVIHNLYRQVNLKITTAFIFVQVFLPIWIAKFSHNHEAKNSVRAVNDSVQ